MKALPVRPLPIASEPLDDYLERLANANGYEIGDFLSLFVNAHCSHVTLLSTFLNGHKLPTFSAPLIRSIEIPVQSFGLQSSDFLHIYKRWCPHCIKQAAWQRPIWRIKVSTVCEVHAVQLMQTCPVCLGRVRLAAIFNGMCECGARFTQFAVPAKRQAHQLSAVMSASVKEGACRLNLKGASPILTTSELVRLIFYTGRFISGPSLNRLGQIKEMDDLTVAASLFDGAATLLGDWPNLFWNCLELYLKERTDDSSVRRVFGALYQVLYKNLKDPPFQFLRDAFELFLLKHWRGELCGRHRLFKLETIQNHRSHGLAQIARVTGRSSGILKRMVHEDLLPANKFSGPKKREHITIDITQVTKFIRDENDCLDLGRAANFLGIARFRLRELVARGGILADSKPNWDRRNRWFFRLDELNKFVEGFRAASQSEVNFEHGVRLRHVLRYWRVSTSELCLLFDEMKRQDSMLFYIEKHCRLSEMVFCSTSLKLWLAKNRALNAEYVTAKIAAKLLRLKEQVVYELIANNFLSANLLSKNGRIFKQIPHASLDRFKQEFISLGKLAIDMNVSAAVLLKQLEVRPVTGPKIDGGRQYFYRRSDLKEASLAR